MREGKRQQIRKREGSSKKLDRGKENDNNNTRREKENGSNLEREDVTTASK
jgi:hypothetical protein